MQRKPSGLASFCEEVTRLSVIACVEVSALLDVLTPALKFAKLQNISVRGPIEIAREKSEHERERGGKENDGTFVR